MNIYGAVIVFIIFWWLVFMPLLNVGVQSQEESGDIVRGSERGAPVRPRILTKAMWASAAALVLTLLTAAVMHLMGYRG